MSKIQKSIGDGLRVRIKFMGQYGRPSLATAGLLVTFSFIGKYKSWEFTVSREHKPINNGLPRAGPRAKSPVRVSGLCPRPKDMLILKSFCLPKVQMRHTNVSILPCDALLAQ